MLDDLAITPASVSLISAVAEPVVDRRGPGGAARRAPAILVRGGDLAGVDERAEREHLLDRAGLVDVGHERAGPSVLDRRGAAGRRRRTSGRRPARGPRRSGVSMTTAKPESPPASSTVWRSTRWVYHCRSRSMVVCRSWPSTAGLIGVVAERDPVAGADLVASRSRRCPTSGLSKVALEAAERLVGAQEADQVGGDVVGRVVAHRVAAGGEPFEAAVLGLARARRWPASTGRGGRCTRTGCPSSRSALERS